MAVVDHDLDCENPRSLQTKRLTDACCCESCACINDSMIARASRPEPELLNPLQRCGHDP